MIYKNSDHMMDTPPSSVINTEKEACMPDIFDSDVRVFCDLNDCRMIYILRLIAGKGLIDEETPGRLFRLPEGGTVEITGNDAGIMVKMHGFTVYLAYGSFWLEAVMNASDPETGIFIRSVRIEEGDIKMEAGLKLCGEPSPETERLWGFMHSFGMYSDGSF